MDCGHQASLPFTAAQVHMSRTALVAQTVESACSGGDLGSIPGLGRAPGGGNGHRLQDSCLESPVGRGAWRAAFGPPARSGYHGTLGRVPRPVPHVLTSYLSYTQCQQRVRVNPKCTVF